MKIYCIDEFRTQLERLKRKNSYKDICADLIDYLFDKEIDDLCTGTVLNNNPDTPYLKKRIKGRGGYRLYYYVLIVRNEIYLMFIHPKSGSLGSENITDDTKAELLSKVSACIRNRDLFELQRSSDGKNIIFKKV